VIRVGTSIIDLKGTPEEEGKMRSRIGALNSLRKCTQRFRLLRSLCLKLYTNKLYMLYTIEHYHRRGPLQFSRWYTHSGSLPMEHATTVRVNLQPTTKSSLILLLNQSAIHYSPLTDPRVRRKHHPRRQVEPRLRVIEWRIQADTSARGCSRRRRRRRRVERELSFPRRP
jgi:hypothetical protein